MRLSLLLLANLMVQLIYAQSTGYAADSSIYGKNDRVGRFVKTRGFNMYYETYGNGEPLLFIHGNGGSIEHFKYQIPYFSKNYRVILADSRAQGKSVDTSDSLSYEMMADDFAALLDTMQLDSCYVIGWSDGGINGLLLAIRHPEKVKKLAITGANLWPDTTAVDPFVYQMVQELNLNFKKMPTTPETKTVLKLINLLANEPHITTEQLRRIQCPTLVIGGDHDVILPQHTMLIAQSIPRSYLWILPDSGHSTPIYYKEQFNQLTADFFRKPYRKIEGVKRFD